MPHGLRIFSNLHSSSSTHLVLAIVWQMLLVVVTRYCPLFMSQCRGLVPSPSCTPATLFLVQSGLQRYRVLLCRILFMMVSCFGTTACVSLIAVSGYN